MDLAGGVLRVYVSPVTRQFACVVALLKDSRLMGRAMASPSSQGIQPVGVGWHKQVDDDEHQLKTR